MSFFPRRKTVPFKIRSTWCRSQSVISDRLIQEIKPVSLSAPKHVCSRLKWAPLGLKFLCSPFSVHILSLFKTVTLPLLLYFASTCFDEGEWESFDPSDISKPGITTTAAIDCTLAPSVGGEASGPRSLWRSLKTSCHHMIRLLW